MQFLKNLWGSWTLRILLAVYIGFGAYNAFGFHTVRYIPDTITSLTGEAPGWIFWFILSWLIAAFIGMLMAKESFGLTGIVITALIVALIFFALQAQGVLTYNTQSLTQWVIPGATTIVLIVAFKWSLFKKKGFALYNTDDE